MVTAGIKNIKKSLGINLKHVGPVLIHSAPAVLDPTIPKIDDKTDTLLACRECQEHKISRRAREDDVLSPKKKKKKSMHIHISSKYHLLFFYLWGKR